MQPRRGVSSTTCGGVAQGLRLVYRNIVLQGELLDRAGCKLLSAPGRAVRLAVHGNDLVGRVEQGLEVFGGEFRGAGKDNTQRLRHGFSLLERKRLAVASLRSEE